MTASDFMDYFSETLSGDAYGPTYRRNLVRFIIEQALTPTHSHLPGLHIDDMVITPGGEEYGFPLTIPLSLSDRATFREALNHIDRMAFFPSLVLEDDFIGMIVIGAVQGRPELELRVKDGRVWLCPAAACDTVLDTTGMVPDSEGNA